MGRMSSLDGLPQPSAPLESLGSGFAADETASETGNLSWVYNPTARPLTLRANNKGRGV